MSVEFYCALEMVRAVCYAAGTLMALYLCIEFANLHDKALAGMMGALSLLYGALLTSVSVRYLGMGGVEARALLTPAVLLHTATLAILVWREYKRTRTVA